jgi:PAS domain S-box-containing protein
MKALKTRKISPKAESTAPRRVRRNAKARSVSEGKYQALFERLPLGLYWTTPQGKIIDLNPTMARMLGFNARDAALGKSASGFYLDPRVREHAIDLLNKDSILRNFEFELRRADGTVSWVQDNVRAVFDGQGRVAYYEGSLLDISHQKHEEEALQRRTSQVIRHQAALLDLANLDLSDMDSAVKTITEISADTLDLERVSVWLFNPEHTEISCRDLFQKSQPAHTRGQTLKAGDYPHYFRALEDSCVIAADNAETDPRTSELTEGYLEPENISSIMDIPIRRNGRVIGIICHEQVGPPRSWTLEEQHFAISVGDTLALAAEASERRRMGRINKSIFNISAAANSAQNLEELFRSIHQVIAEFMPARNFYIALYDSAKNILSFPYFEDECDEAPPAKPPGRGLTEYVLRTGKPLLASPEVFGSLQEQGEVDLIGAPSIDWLGVPLIIDGRPIGVLVVQTYTEGVRYGEEEKNILQFVCDQVSMAVHRRKSEEELQESERFLASVFESIQDGLSILDRDCRIIRVNPAMERWYSHAMPLVGKTCDKDIRLQGETCETCPTRKTMETGAAACEIIPRVGPGGEITGWLDLYSFPLIDQKTGEMQGAIEYIRDITERKAAEDRLQASLREKEVLLREVHHRVKNNMQVISSLLNLQSRRIQDPDVLEMFRESQRRIRSMALIHERLYQSSDLARIEFSQYLRNLATHLFHSYQISSDRVRLRLDAEEVFLNINTAIPCGLIINELISNALKHGFPEGRTGEVVVELHRVLGNGYIVRVRDDGVGFPEGLDYRRTETLGMQIVNTLVGQIEGRLDLARGPAGSTFSLEFNELPMKKRP